jgi:hypothetical protein
MLRKTKYCLSKPVYDYTIKQKGAAKIKHFLAATNNL